jgi:hypothetical protein
VGVGLREALRHLKESALWYRDFLKRQRALRSGAIKAA